MLPETSLQPTSCRIWFQHFRAWEVPVQLNPEPALLGDFPWEEPAIWANGFIWSSHCKIQLPGFRPTSISLSWMFRWTLNGQRGAETTLRWFWPPLGLLGVARPAMAKGPKWPRATPKFFFFKKKKKYYYLIFLIFNFFFQKIIYMTYDNIWLVLTWHSVKFWTKF